MLLVAGRWCRIQHHGQIPAPQKPTRLCGKRGGGLVFTARVNGAMRWNPWQMLQQARGAVQEHDNSQRTCPPPPLTSAVRRQLSRLFPWLWGAKQEYAPKWVWVGSSTWRFTESAPTLSRGRPFPPGDPGGCPQPLSCKRGRVNLTGKRGPQLRIQAFRKAPLNGSEAASVRREQGRVPLSSPPPQKKQPGMSSRRIDGEGAREQKSNRADLVKPIWTTLAFRGAWGCFYPKRRSLLSVSGGGLAPGFFSRLAGL